MKVVEFLNGFESIKDGLNALETQYGIKSKEYPEENVILLNYDQITSPKNEQIVRECRSLVIDFDCNVISRSFDRFFNLGEGECSVDFSGAYAFEKADGSLISLYFNPFNKKWNFRTRGTAFAEAQLPSGRSYLEAILETIGYSQEELQLKMSGVDESITFIFEFVSPENRIVTRYKEPQLVLLACRSKYGIYPNEMNLAWLEEVASIFNETIGFKNVRSANMMRVSTADYVLKAVESLTDLQEGFVVVDRNHNRVKVKSAAYLIAHRIRGEGLTPRRAAELVAISEEEEYLSYFEEDRAFFKKFIDARDSIISNAEDVLHESASLVSQKDFALAVKDYPFSALLFTARKSGDTILKTWANSKDSYRTELILKAFINDQE